jgi:hypothetical protein
MYLLRLPEDFVPEEYGWEVRNPIVPHQQLQAAMYELHRYGYVSTFYVRSEPDSDLSASLAFTGYDAVRREYRCMYCPPSERSDREVTAAQLREEIRGYVGHSDGSRGKSPVSR